MASSPRCLSISLFAALASAWSGDRPSRVSMVSAVKVGFLAYTVSHASLGEIDGRILNNNVLNPQKPIQLCTCRAATYSCTYSYTQL